MSLDYDSIDDQKFEAALAAKRHKEMTDSLTVISNHLSKEKPNDGVREAIDKQTASINSLVNAISNLPKQEKPEINIQNNNDELGKSIEALGRLILDGFKELKDEIALLNVPRKERQFEFKVSRGTGGYIDNITAKEKI